MSRLEPWPDVDVDVHGYMTCPIAWCGAEIHLIRHYAILLVAEQGFDHEPEHAVSDSWEVECTDGHKLHTSVDQAREQNANGAELDETADYAPEYDHFITHLRIGALRGEQR